MLTHLSIQNLVLIEKAELEFGRGLVVLSGETGAGKSILLDALGLALGSKSEARLVRAGAEKASVTASFDASNQPRLKALLESLGFDAADEIILRRQLSADGKSKAWLNDEPIGIKALKDVGERLVEIHGQHQQRGLLDAAQHLGLLDGYAHVAKERTILTAAHAAWKAAQKQLAELRANLERSARERDYLDHMRAELSALAPQRGEEDRLAEIRSRMMQSEKMAQTLGDAKAALDQPRRVVEALRAAERILARSTLTGAAAFHSAIEALEKASNEVEIAYDTLKSLGENCGYEPRELEDAEERLFALRAAARKHATTPDELVGLLEGIEGKLKALETGEAEALALEKNVAEAKAAYHRSALDLRGKREKAAAALEKALLKELPPLKMEATRFRVAFTPKEEAAWSASGIDSVQFEAATNRGSEPGPLAAIASGGELSRFMLALAVVLADVKATPVMIFDEIDSGTGGAVADAIGRRLEALGRHAQVLVVTHLPQVAARGAEHFFIEKTSRGDTTTTHVRPLATEERREELARMLSGSVISEEARAAADKLLATENPHAA